MASFNRVILLGNLTRDVELRYTPSGMAVTEIGMAVNEKRKDGNGEWVEDVTFVDVTLWGRTAEIAGEYLGKGSPVLIEGRLKQDKWQDKNTGENRYKLKIVGEKLQMLGSKRDGDGGGGRGNGGGGSRGGNRRSGYQGGGGGGDYGGPANDGPVNDADSYSYGSGSSAPPDDIPF